VQPEWSPDSRQVLFIDKPSANAPAGIYAVDIFTGALKPPQFAGRVGLYSQDRSLVAYSQYYRTVVERVSTGEKWTLPVNDFIWFSPDNRHVAWNDAPDNVSPYDQRRSDVYVASITGTQVTRLASLYGGGFSGWLSDSKVLLTGRPSLAAHERALMTLDLTTRVTNTLVMVERISDLTVSRNGAWIAYSITFDTPSSRNGIWVQRADGTQARRLELWGAYQWRDDSHLLIIPPRASSVLAFEVWEVDAASGQARRLTDAATTPLRILNGDWRVSPDGRYIVYVNSVDRNLWLLELPVSGGR